VARLRPHIRNHDRVAVAADRVLQNVRQLALPELHEVVPLAAGQADDGLLKKRERLVDVLRLDLRLADGLGLVEPLRAGQVDQIELGQRVLLVARRHRLALDADREDAVGAGALLVEDVRAD